MFDVINAALTIIVPVILILWLINRKIEQHDRRFRAGEILVKSDQTIAPEPDDAGLGRTLARSYSHAEVGAPEQK
jgi:hypothetical protein